MKVNKIQPSVRLINQPDINGGYSLWIKSREAIIEYDGNDIIVGGYRTDKIEYINSILKQNLQYNNFPFYIFEIRGSLLSRDVFFTFNEIAQWSVSSRFFHSLTKEVNYDAFSLSGEYDDTSQLEEFIRLMEIESNPDKARLKMPYSMSTRYWIGLNFKQLTSFLALLRDRLPQIYEVYGKLILSEVPEIEKFIPKFVDSVYEKYFSPKKEFKEDKVEVNDFIHLSTKMGMIMYSQFIRQSSTVTSGLYDWIINHPGEVPIGETPIEIYHTTHKDRFLRTISNRTCAFSMSDEKSINSWYTILEPYLKDKTLDEFKEILPCEYDGNKLKRCPFREDIKFRNNKFEKNLPCPMLACNVKLAEERYKRSDTTLNRLYLDLTKTLEPSEVTLRFDEREED